MKNLSPKLYWMRSELDWVSLKKWLICCHQTVHRKSPRLRVCVYLCSPSHRPTAPLSSQIPCPTLNEEFLQPWMLLSIFKWIPERRPVNDKEPWTTPTKKNTLSAGRSGSVESDSCEMGGQRSPNTRQTVLHTVRGVTCLLDLGLD